MHELDGAGVLHFLLCPDAVPSTEINDLDGYFIGLGGVYYLVVVALGAGENVAPGRCQGLSKVRKAFCGNEIPELGPDDLTGPARAAFVRAAVP